MALRKFLFWNDTYGYQEEAAAADSLQLGGLSMSGGIDMNSNKVTELAAGTSAGDALSYNQASAKLSGLNVDTNNLTLTNSATITGLPSSPTGATEAVSKTYADNIASSILWKPPVTTINMISDADQSGAPPGSPVKGDAYVVNNWGGGYTNGDVIEYNGTSWVVLIDEGGTAEPPDGCRVVVSGTSATSGAGSFAGQDNKIGVYNATTNAWTFSAPSDGWSTLVEDEESIYHNLGYTYDATDTTWILFNGAGQVAAGVGLGKDGNTLYAKLGDGITELPSGEIGVDLSTASGLELTGTSPDKELQLKVHATTPGLEIDGANGVRVKWAGDKGIVVTSSGVEIEIDDSPDTLDVDADGLKVVGLPSLFKINGTAVGATVTATNLDDLTDGGETTLHTHPGVSESERTEYTFTAIENLAKGDPIYVTATNDNVGKARADTDAKSNVYGIAKAAITSGNPGDIVMQGRVANILTAATAGNRYWLAATGGYTTSVPGAGNRIVHIGVAVNATDMIIDIRDFGKKAA